MISKAAALTVQRERGEKDLERLEQQIDAEIARGSQTRAVSVDVTDVAAVSVALARQKYEIGGWTVDMVRDQNDRQFMLLR